MILRRILKDKYDISSQQSTISRDLAQMGAYKVPIDALRYYYRIRRLKPPPNRPAPMSPEEV